MIYKADIRMIVQKLSDVDAEPITQPGQKEQHKQHTSIAKATRSAENMRHSLRRWFHGGQQIEPNQPVGQHRMQLRTRHPAATQHLKYGRAINARSQQMR